MRKNSGKILVVDDNALIRATLKILLPMHFSGVDFLSSPVTLLSKVREYQPDAVLLDMNFTSSANTGNEGLFYLDELHRTFPELKVVLFTAYADVLLAVEGMKRGAFDFVVKPWDNERLISILTSAVGSGQKKAPVAPAQLYWGATPAMSEIHRLVEKSAPTDASILITGENGTGKDVLAAELHRASLRSGQPFVSVDAGAIPETLFESELFGHVKGAFTDAKSDHTGKFVQADGGTLFLDEVGNIPLSMQAKLLRALQSRTITPVGDTRSIPVNIRLICATNMDIARMVSEGTFREDLYYRINTIHLHLPALRQRAEDIVPLAEIFLHRYAQKYHRGVSALSVEVQKALSENLWRGNIRELQNCIEKAVILSEGSALSVSDLQLPQHEAFISASDEAPRTLDEAEERLIREALTRCSGNLSLVAKSLGISRPTLYNKLKKYGI